MLTDNMVKIQVAIESGAIVKNSKGELIALPIFDGQRTDDCIKCYVNSTHYYWSTAEVQKEIIVNGLHFDEWFEQQPIGFENIDKLK